MCMFFDRSQFHFVKKSQETISFFTVYLQFYLNGLWFQLCQEANIDQDAGAGLLPGCFQHVVPNVSRFIPTKLGSTVSSMEWTTRVSHTSFDICYFWWICLGIAILVVLCFMRFFGGHVRDLSQEDNWQRILYLSKLEHWDGNTKGFVKQLLWQTSCFHLSCLCWFPSTFL